MHLLIRAHGPLHKTRRNLWRRLLLEGLQWSGQVKGDCSVLGGLRQCSKANRFQFKCFACGPTCGESFVSASEILTSVTGRCLALRRAKMVQWDDKRLLDCAHGKLSHQGDLVVVQQTTPIDSSNTGIYAQLKTLQPPSDPQEHLKLLQQAGVDATWVPLSVEHSSLYEDNVLKLVGGRWVRRPDVNSIPEMKEFELHC